MNDILPSELLHEQRRAKPWHASPQETKALENHFATVQAFQTERIRLSTWSRRSGWIVAGVASALALIEACSIAVMIPLQRQVPIPIIMRDDGSTEVAWSWRDVMPDNKAAVVTSALWFYVRSREGFNAADARQNYDSVGAMSAPNVRDTYQRWFLPSNPDSPQLKIGKNGQISIQYDGSMLSRDAPVIRIFYWRTVQMDGSQPQKTHWTATLDYRVDEPVPAASRLFNPQGIVVTSYLAQEDTAK